MLVNQYQLASFNEGGEERDLSREIVWGGCLVLSRSAELILIGGGGNKMVSRWFKEPCKRQCEKVLSVQNSFSRVIRGKRCRSGGRSG